MNESIVYSPVGFFKSSHKQTYQAPRQGVLAKDSSGFVEFNKEYSKATFEDLIGFDRVWLIYDFHQNHTWSEKVRPPRFSNKKRSVFATRSPYRPNKIGISCVRVDKILENRLYVFDHDLLDETPILDIKPYLPYADSFEDVKTGWVSKEAPYKVLYCDEALMKIDWLFKKTDINFKQIIENQLAFEPTSNKSKRVKKSDEEDCYFFAIRTWRFKFKLLEKEIEILSVFGSYSKEDLILEEDPHSDKKTHKEFLKNFSG